MKMELTINYNVLETFGSIGADQHVRKGAELGIKNDFSIHLTASLYLVLGNLRLTSISQCS